MHREVGGGGDLVWLLRMWYHASKRWSPQSRFMMWESLQIWSASNACLCLKPCAFLWPCAPFWLMLRLVVWVCSTIPFFSLPLLTACLARPLLSSGLSLSHQCTLLQSLQGTWYTTSFSLLGSSVLLAQNTPVRDIVMSLYNIGYTCEDYMLMWLCIKHTTELTCSFLQVWATYIHTGTLHI